MPRFWSLDVSKVRCVYNVFIECHSTNAESGVLRAGRLGSGRNEFVFARCQDVPPKSGVRAVLSFQEEAAFQLYELFPLLVESSAKGLQQAVCVLTVYELLRPLKSLQCRLYIESK